ncbi:MAG: methyltransferase domain-containing protein [Xanthomonadales bacterium]|nr:methyltransferase domain-containing protein [Xanthomonadales bacterium]
MDVQPEAVQAAEAYEAMFVPALFAQWAPRVLDGVALSPGQRVLDVACGTGVLAREAARRVGLSGAVSGLDPAPGMLAVARRSAEVVDWREGVAESLPYADGQFDAVVSQFGLMFFADRVQALREMRRVLRPAGRLAVAVWSGLETMPALLREVAVVESLAGSAAADALRAPFCLADAGRLQALANSTGWLGISVQRLAGQACFPSIRFLVEADLRGWLPLMGVELDEGLIQRILDTAESSMRNWVEPDGTARFEVSAFLLTASSPV